MATVMESELAFGLRPLVADLSRPVRRRPGPAAASRRCGDPRRRRSWPLRSSWIHSTQAVLSSSRLLLLMLFRFYSKIIPIQFVPAVFRRLARRVARPALLALGSTVSNFGSALQRAWPDALAKRLKSGQMANLSKFT